MKKLTNRERIAKRDEEENKTQKKSFFGRRKAFVDPTNKSMKYNRFDTYEENKQDYYTTLQLVFTGKCKDIFEAYALNR